MFRAHRAHHQERQIVSIQSLVTVTLCRWSCRVQVVKNCASRWSFTKNHNMMHCQQNVKFFNDSVQLLKEETVPWCWHYDKIHFKSQHGLDIQFLTPDSIGTTILTKMDGYNTFFCFIFNSTNTLGLFQASWKKYLTKRVQWTL